MCHPNLYEKEDTAILVREWICSSDFFRFHRHAPP